MDAAASEIGDWEVLDAAFASGDDGEVLVSGDGGAVLHDHFALVSHVGFSSEGSWSVAASDAEEEDAIPEVAGKRVGRGGGESLHFDVAGGCAGSEGHEFLEQLDRLDSISLGSLDLYVADSSVQLEAGGIDETRESSVLKTAVTSDASLSALEKQVEAKGSEIEQEKNAKLVRSELDSDQQVFHHGTGEDLDLHSTTIGDESKRQGTSNPEVQLEAEGVDAAIESSFLEAVVATDAQEKQDQEKSGAFACNELDGEVRGGSLPLVQSSGAGKGEKRGVVWWRLPFRLLQYCALNVKPVWSLSIAAALVGLVVLGRGMYRMRHKSRGIPQIKIAFDDKKTSQFADRAARLNEAFLMVKRVPVIRTSSGAVLPWSMVQERC